MDIRTQQLCSVAVSLRETHGVFFAAAFLFDNGIDLELALSALARGRPIGERLVYAYAGKNVAPLIERPN